MWVPPFTRQGTLSCVCVESKQGRTHVFTSVCSPRYVFEVSTLTNHNDGWWPGTVNCNKPLSSLSCFFVRVFYQSNRMKLGQMHMKENTVLFFFLISKMFKSRELVKQWGFCLLSKSSWVSFPKSIWKIPLWRDFCHANPEEIDTSWHLELVYHSVIPLWQLAGQWKTLSQISKQGGQCWRITAR